MSFIIKSAISYEEALVLRFTLQKVTPQLEIVAKDAKDERKNKAEKNLEVARDMLADLDNMFKDLNKT